MGNTTRKLRRNKAKEAEKELSQKVGMFDRMPDSCISCEASFDKKDREMVQSWFVVVKEKEKKVNLYCPPCWAEAQNILEDFRKRLEDKMSETEGDEKDND